MTYERCLVGPGKHAASYRRWVLRRGRGKQATAGSFLVGFAGGECNERAGQDSTAQYCPTAGQLWAKLRDTEVAVDSRLVAATATSAGWCVKDVVVIK